VLIACYSDNKLIRFGKGLVDEVMKNIKDKKIKG
jgi:hypothetical protein